MPKYLFRGSYSQEGIKGVKTEGVSARMDVSRALATTVGSSGAMSSFETIPLLTPEAADEAARRSVNYRPPGA